MCDKYCVLDPDNYDIGMFGVINKGVFDANGLPTGWSIADEIWEELPLWCKDQPVLYLNSDESYSVYLRGLYSKQLSKERRASIIR